MLARNIGHRHPGIMLSAAIRARSAFVRRRRPLGPSITSSRETPTLLEPSKWTPILPSLSKANTSATPAARKMPGSNQQWQEGVGVALTHQLWCTSEFSPCHPRLTATPDCRA